MRRQTAQKRDRSDRWIDMAFFCLHRLKMSPEQVAEMLSPDDRDFRETMTFHLRDHYANALAESELQRRFPDL